MTFTIIMLIGIYANAKTVSHKNVSFQIELDKAIKLMPCVVIFEEGVYQYDGAKVGQKKIEPTTIKGNTYFFDLKKQNRPLYFSVLLTDEKNELVAIQAYHFEPGDQINMVIKPTKFRDKFETEYSGPGSAKYRCRAEMWSSSVKNEASGAQFFISGKESGINDADLLIMNHSYRVIEQYKSGLSTYSYNLLHADVLGTMGQYIFETLRHNLVRLKSTGDTAAFNRMTKTFKLNFAYDFTKNVPDSVLAYSRNYAEFLSERLKAKTVAEFGTVNFKAMFDAITKTKNDALRDKMILNLFLRDWNALDTVFDYIFENSLLFIKDKKILARVKTFNNNRVGTRAQKFTLPDSNGRMVSLNDFKGKVVMIDFWYTGCGACENYYNNVLSKVEERYRNDPNIVFITVSIDSKEIWLRSLKDGVHTSEKVINLYTNGERDEHQIIKSYNVRSYPRPMLISKKGMIACVNHKTLRNFDSLVTTIEEQISVAN